VLACLLLSAASPLFVRDRLLHKKGLIVGAHCAKLSRQRKLASVPSTVQVTITGWLKRCAMRALPRCGQ